MSERTSPREEGNARPVTLYQSEWCPFSAAVREVLTELGLPFVAGTDQIPVLLTEDGTLHRGTRAIFSHLRERDAWPHAAEHRQRFHDHRDARETDVPGQLIEYFRETDELQDAASKILARRTCRISSSQRWSAAPR